MLPNYNIHPLVQFFHFIHFLETTVDDLRLAARNKKPSRRSSRLSVSASLTSLTSARTHNQSVGPRTRRQVTGQADSTAQHRAGQHRIGQDSTAQHSTRQHRQKDRTGQYSTVGLDVVRSEVKRPPPPPPAGFAPAALASTHTHVRTHTHHGSTRLLQRPSAHLQLQSESIPRILRSTRCPCPSCAAAVAL